MPTGTRLDDGFSTRISFSLKPNVGLWEKEVTPPGLDATGPIQTETMRNLRWRTRNPKALVTGTDCVAVCAYDEACYGDLLSMLGKNQLITLTFPNGRPLYFYGWVDKFAPNALKEGEQPTAVVTIIVSNQDTNQVETGPVIGTTVSTSSTTTTTTAAPATTTSTTTTTTPAPAVTTTTTTTSTTTTTTTTTAAPTTTSTTTTTTTTTAAPTTTTTTTTTSTTTTTTTTTTANGNTLTWGGDPITWGGDPITWG